MAHALDLPLARSEREQLLRTAEARLHPLLTDPNFLVLRGRRIIFEKWVAQIQSRKLDILDVGGRYQPYRPLFAGRIRRYLACDVLQTQFVSVVSDGECLPFAENSFDVVIATQVFEYFSQPQRAAEQIHAALKRGGVLLMSVAALAPRFVDEERWRFTPHGIRTSLRCFSEVSILPETASLGGIVRTINVAAHSFFENHAAKALVASIVCPLVNLAGLCLECLKLTSNDQFTPNYSVMAIK
jgi:SAM-dependent methyltransferase